MLCLVQQIHNLSCGFRHTTGRRHRQGSDVGVSRFTCHAWHHPKANTPRYLACTVMVVAHTPAGRTKMTASNTTPLPEFLSRLEVAQWLNLHPRSLGNMASQGRGPKFMRTSHLQGRALYRREDVLAWLESNVGGRNAKAASQGHATSNVEAASTSQAKPAKRRAKGSDAVSSTSVSRGRSASSCADETTQCSTVACSTPAGKRRKAKSAKTFGRLT